MSQDTVEQAKIRLLRCDTCKTLEELPDFDGPAEYDVHLNYLLSQHRTPEGHPHVGRLIDVPQKAWDMPNLRQALISQISAGISPGLDAFGDFYSVKDTFKEDALTCYAQHLRPKDFCPDFNSPSKRLLPDTKADRKEAGLPQHGMPVIHLCSFCPMRSIMEKKARGD